MAILRTLGRFFEFDISEIECLHAALRRLLRGRKQTWTKASPDLSADWVIARNRVLEYGRWWMLPPKSVAVDPSVQPPPQQPHNRPGGTHRSTFSEMLTGAKIPPGTRKQFFADLQAAYKRLVVWSNSGKF